MTENRDRCRARLNSLLNQEWPLPVLFFTVAVLGISYRAIDAGPVGELMAFVGMFHAAFGVLIAGIIIWDRRQA